MDNRALGICVVLICACGYIFAFKKQKNNRPATALLLLVICGLLLRTFSAADMYLHEWDERYHALVAKHLLQHWLKPTLYEKPLLPYSYSEWTFSHIWLHKQPVPLWLMALSLKTFGLHVWAVRVPSVIISAIGIKLVYDLAKYMYDARTAFIAAFLFSINGAVIELAAGRHATEHIDIAFMFFVLLGVWLAMKHAATGRWSYTLAIGASIGAAIMCKWLPALIVIPVWALMSYKLRTTAQLAAGLVCILASAAIVCVPWQLYIMQHFPAEAASEYSFNSRHMFEVLSKQSGNFFYHFDCLRMEYGELVYIPMLWFTWRGLRLRQGNDLALLTWFWAVYLFFSICATKMSAYTIFAGPAVIIISARAWRSFADRRVPPLPKWLAVTLAWAFLLLPIRYTIERVKPFNTIPRNPGWNRTIERFAQSAGNTPKTVVLNCDHSIEMMFATDCTAYDHDIEDSTASRLKGDGYLLLVQHGDVFEAR